MLPTWRAVWRNGITAYYQVQPKGLPMRWNSGERKHNVAEFKRPHLFASAFEVAQHQSSLEEGPVSLSLYLKVTKDAKLTLGKAASELNFIVENLEASYWDGDHAPQHTAIASVQSKIKEQVKTLQEIVKEMGRPAPNLKADWETYTLAEAIWERSLSKTSLPKV